MRLQELLAMLVNNVGWLIGPEYLYRWKQQDPPGRPREHFVASGGLPLGVDVCITITWAEPG